MVTILLLNEIVAGVWEVYAISKFFELEHCTFNIGYFNLIFYTGYMIHALLSWIFLPIIGFHFYR